jgi:hypothetical protein
MSDTDGPTASRCITLLALEQSAPAGSVLTTEETYLVLVTIFDDWGKFFSLRQDRDKIGGMQ